MRYAQQNHLRVAYPVEGADEELDSVLQKHLGGSIVLQILPTHHCGDGASDVQGKKEQKRKKMGRNVNKKKEI